MNTNDRPPLLAALTLLAALVAALSLAIEPATASTAEVKSSAPKPALTVAVVTPKGETWPQTLAANGSLAAWREVQVGTEATGQRIERVMVELGQRVKKGQLLAQLQSASLDAELAATRASLLEAQAGALEAAANLARLKPLAGSDAVSAQQIDQATAQNASAAARVASLKARVVADELRLSHTRVLAPVDGIVSAKEAVEGALPQPGQSLFVLIREGRVEWRAEVPASDLAQLSPGQKVRVTPAGGAAIEGRVRLVAPTVDAATRNGRVMVDLPASSSARAGMFARGEFVIGEAPVLSLPQSAVLLRDGFAYAFKLDGATKVKQVKLEIGRRLGERVEVRAGLAATDKVVAQGVGFLADGDTVRVSN